MQPGIRLPASSVCVLLMEMLYAWYIKARRIEFEEQFDFIDIF